jgi:hypothetical protein
MTSQTFDSSTALAKASRFRHTDKLSTHRTGEPSYNETAGAGSS